MVSHFEPSCASTKIKTPLEEIQLLCSYGAHNLVWKGKYCLLVTRVVCNRGGNLKYGYIHVSRLEPGFGAYADTPTHTSPVFPGLISKWGGGGGGGGGWERINVQYLGVNINGTCSTS